MSKYLFIGGPKDGEHLEVSDGANNWMIREMGNTYYGNRCWSIEDYTPDFKFEYNDYVYVKQSFSGKNGRHFIFVYDQIPDVMGTLLKGYRKRKSVKKKPKIYLT